MRLVPRQLRRTDFPGSVPYYGGRLTPNVIAGLGRPPAGAPTGPPPGPPAGPPTGRQPVPIAGDTARQMADLERLRDDGVLTEDEYQSFRQRLTRGE